MMTSIPLRFPPCGRFAALLTCALLVACGDDASGDGDDGLAMGGDTSEVTSDMREVSCTGEPPSASAGCEPAATRSFECVSAQHIPDETPIPYDEVPPACGPHRAQWAVWGEYGFLPPQRYIHNLEHGGIALLHHPCATEETIAELRTFAAAQPIDDGGPFRVVMSPFPDLPTDVAVLAWGERLLTNCFDPTEAQAFVDAHYRTAPEDVSVDGRYDVGLVGPVAQGSE